MILVIAEQRDGKLNRASWEALAAAQALAGTDPITIVVPGGSTTAVAQELAAGDVVAVLVVEHPALAHYTPDAWTQALRTIVEQVKPSYVVLPHTYQTRDFAPMLAARLHKPLITDVTGVVGTGAVARVRRPCRRWTCR